MGRASSVVVLCAGVSAFAGCHKSATELLVVVKSDLTIPSQLSGVKAVTFSSEQGPPVAEADFALHNMSDLPLTFAVVPRTDDLTVPAIVELHAVGPKTFAVRAHATFSAGQTLLLPMFLLGACADMTCPGSLTCHDGRCASDVYDSLKPLPSGSDGTDAPFPATPDGGPGPGPMDSGVPPPPPPDASVGGADSGVGPGPVDGGGSAPTCTMTQDCASTCPSAKGCKCVPPPPGTTGSNLCAPACMTSADCNGMTCDTNMGICMK